MKFKSLSIIAIAGLSLCFCKSPEKVQVQNNQVSMPNPLIIYKTKANFNQLTPINLNQEGTMVTGYPAPGDLKKGSALRKPIHLKDGYLLDQRGIGVSTAFISLTYDQYAQLQAAPTPQELLNLIVEKQPITEMWRCKRRLTDSLNVIYANELIETSTLLQECTRLK